MPRWDATVRTLVGAVGVLIILGGFVAFGVGQPMAGLWAFVSGGVLLFAAVFEVGRYRSKADANGRSDGFQPTDEIFEDPTTGLRMRVWFDPRTGDRRYEPDR